MRTMIAASAIVALLAGAMPASAGPGRWYGPYAYGPRLHPWAWGGSRRFAYRRYGGFRGFYGRGASLGGYGGGGRQTMTGGPSGGLPGGS